MIEILHDLIYRNPRIYGSAVYICIYVYIYVYLSMYIIHNVYIYIGSYRISIISSMRDVLRLCVQAAQLPWPLPGGGAAGELDPFGLGQERRAGLQGPPYKRII